MADFAKQRLTMVDTQVRPSDVTKFPIIDAMLDVPREAFLPDVRRDMAYVGGPIDIAPGRVLLEARTIAKMLDAADLERNDVVLELGSGLGYCTALLAHMVEAVVAVEVDEDLASEAEATLADHGIDNAAVVTGALAAGYAKDGPYDAIFLFGGIEVCPDVLADQLKDGGRIVGIFMNGAHGEVRVGLKSGGRLNWRMEFNASAEILPGFEREETFSF
jgi:protein-L-isoaspartate(D-aspartate) O-methyltransferase